MIYFSLLIAGSLVVLTSAQSVAQQCLTDQLRLTNPIIAQNQQAGPPEVITMAAFDSICRNFQAYVNCFQTRLPVSNLAADRFLRLIFSAPDMELAYRGLCTQDLELIRRNIRCVISTPAVRNCYTNFNLGVNQVVTLQNQQNQNRLPLLTIQDLACNVSVARYQCESDVYRQCDDRTGRAMQDFFFASIPGECRRVTGVRSRLTNTNTNNNNRVNTSHILSASLAMVAMLLTATALNLCHFN